MERLKRTVDHAAHVGLRNVTLIQILTRALHDDAPFARVPSLELLRVQLPSDAANLSDRVYISVSQMTGDFSRTGARGSRPASINARSCSIECSSMAASSSSSKFAMGRVVRGDPLGRMLPQTAT